MSDGYKSVGNMCVPVPARSEKEGLRFLEGIAAGNICIAFGITTSGWGLLACGVIGGAGGGYLGSKAGNKIYLLKQEYIKTSNMNKGFDVYDPNKFMKKLP